VRTSIEGYSLQGLADLWRDPSLSSEEFATSARAVIVIDTNFDRTTSLFKIQVVSIGQGTPVKPAIPATGVSGPISLSTYPSQPLARGQTVVLGPDWPMSDTYCYAFPRALWFYCLPSQVCDLSYECPTS
jgi:casein kinase I family protein HRR25